MSGEVGSVGLGEFGELGELYMSVLVGTTGLLPMV